MRLPFCLILPWTLVGQIDALSSRHPKWTRRDVFRSTSLVSLVLGTEATAAVDSTPSLTQEYYNRPVTAASKGRSYFPTLTPPFTNRATYRYELGKGAWAFEQLLTFANVTATIRTNVIQLETGGLWVHSPQYPTGEFCHLLNELGTVEHVVLPCDAFEHAGPMQAFCKKYPRASVWVSPGQYGPFGSCGLTLSEPCSLGYNVDGIFSLDATARPPWSNEFDYATLYVDLPENAGPVSEVAFLHKPTKTLVATDGVVYIPDTPSDILSTYFDQETLNDPSFWPKTVLQSVFLPLREENGRYPGFDAIQGRLLRAPILRGFNDARAPQQTREWITKIADWKFDRIITSHFASPIASTPQAVRNAFSFLFQDGTGSMESLPPIACKDWELLDGLNEFIATNKVGAPATFDYRIGCR
jgi:hypothetical protein